MILKIINTHKKEYNAILKRNVWRKKELLEVENVRTETQEKAQKKDWKVRTEEISPQKWAK